jgi:Putative transposase
MLAREGAPNGQSGAVIAIQRTSSDMKCSPHLHVVFVDGVFRDRGDSVPFTELSRLSTSEVGDVLAHATTRMTKHLRKRGWLTHNEGEEEDPELARLTASAVSGNAPPAGPEFRRGALPLSHVPLKFDKPLCAALDGFTLHAATRAGGLDPEGREALLKYILRPAIAQERVTQGPGGLVRIALKRPFGDGTVAIDMDPLSLLCRLAASVPPPRLHTVRYAGVLGPASKIRPRILPEPKAAPGKSLDVEGDTEDKPRRGFRYWPWLELLKRTFQIDLRCPTCQGPMKLVAMVTEERSIARFLRSLGEPTEAPPRVPARGPPYWKSTVLRRMSRGDAA